MIYQLESTQIMTTFDEFSSNLFTLELGFQSQKAKYKSKTERVKNFDQNSGSNHNQLKVHDLQLRQILREKKQNYSHMIREKNLQAFKKKSVEKFSQASKSQIFSFSKQCKHKFDRPVLDYIESEVKAAETEQLFNQTNQKASNSKKLQIQSEVLAYTHIVSEPTSELSLTMKQNQTFKRQLGAARKENSQLKKSLEEANLHIKQLTAKAAAILEDCTESKEHCEQLGKGEQAGMEPTNQEHLKTLLEMQQEKYLLVEKECSCLLLKNFMLEKRLLAESEIHKKIMANQIHQWREKYVKLRNENLKIKGSRKDWIFDISKSQGEDLASDGRSRLLD